MFCLNPARRSATVAAGVLLVCLTGRADAHDLASARKLLMSGKYAEALEAYTGLSKDRPLESVLGAARCRRAVGELDAAKSGLREALKAISDRAQAARLHGELADLALEQGDLAQADEHSRAAIAGQDDELAGRWVQAELHRLKGQLEEANEAYRWFVTYYNDRDTSDAEALRWIGLAAAQYARWNRLTDQFHFLVNELYVDALRLEPDFWPAHHETGRLFLEKYNEADAVKALKAALALNPQSATTYVALAELAIQNFELGEAKKSLDQALAINPNLLEAHLVQADVHFCNLDALQASEVLRVALPLKPNAEEVL